jgi:hypothetical protein
MPLGTPSYTDPRVTFGIERCYVFRSVYTFGSMTLTSDPSTAGCMTFRDTFPPASPTGLTAVAADGVVNLIWGAGSEVDLAGYLILRGGSTGETLQPLTLMPIVETSYRDTTVTPGQRYVYAVEAVDRGVPPNVSQPSESIQVTAR